MSLDAFAKERHDLHVDHATSRPLSDGYEKVGLAGELAFSQFTGMAPDLSVKPEGDGGVDTTIFLAFTVDVKTARKAYNLIHEIDKPFADIFVLAEYDDDSEKAMLVGWEYGSILRKAPSKDFGYGIENHFIHRSRLRPMNLLRKRLLRLKHD